MMRARHEWQAMLRSLGGAFTDLLAAESSVIGAELKRNGRDLGIVAGLVGLAFALLLWAAGVATAFLVALLSLWLPVWGACLAVFGLHLLVIAVLGGLALARLKKLEGPFAIVGRRWRDHWDWWQEQVLAEEPTVRVRDNRLEEER